MATELAYPLSQSRNDSTAPVDEGDALVRLVSEKLKQGQDWRQVADDEDAVASARVSRGVWGPSSRGCSSIPSPRSS